LNEAASGVKAIGETQPAEIALRIRLYFAYTSLHGFRISHRGDKGVRGAVQTMPP
jgi:hypothetical protein